MKLISEEEFDKAAQDYHVPCKCDFCEVQFTRRKQAIMNSVTPHDCCGEKKCKNKLAIARGAKSIADYAHLLNQWHPTLNGENNPSEIQAGSDDKVWWKCYVANGHEWPSKVYSRTTNDSGCPFCSGHRVTPEESLQAFSPEVADEWDHEKNGKVKPIHVSPYSNKKYNWICKKCGYSYKADPAHRLDKKNPTGCPQCAKIIIGKKVKERALKVNRLSESVEHCEIADEWDYEKNFPVTPHDVSIGTHDQYYFKCKQCGTSYRARLSNRTRKNGSGCSNCNSNSILENTVNELLNDIGITFKREQRFDKCRNELELPFDFAIFVNDLPIALIECQGKQHYLPFNFGSTVYTPEETLKKIQNNDNIKLQYCQDNNIPFLRVPYLWDDVEIEYELTKFLAGLGLIPEQPR